MFGFQKIPKKEKKNVRENDFLVFGYPLKKYKRKSNIIKVS